MLADDSSRGRIAQLVDPLVRAAQSAPDTPSFLAEIRAAKPGLADFFRDSGRGDGSAQLLALKTLNLIVSRRDLERRARVTAGKPHGLIVDPSDGCNLKCPACVHSDTPAARKLFDWSPGMIPPARMTGFLDQYGPFAMSIYFYDYGEPLLNPRTPDYVRQAKRWFLRTLVSTNLSIKKLDAEAIVESGLDMLTLSIDGATQETYGAYRRGGDLDLVLANIEKLVEAKRRLGRSTPILNWQFLVFEHNEHEIARATELARQCGVNRITFTVPFDVSWDAPEIRLGSRRENEMISFDHEPDYLPRNHARFDSEVDEARAAEVFESAWSDEEAAAACDRDTAPGSDALCHWLYKNMVMNARGHVMPCCGPPSPQWDLVYASFDGDGNDGDVFNSPKFQIGRLGFQDKAAAEREIQALGLDRAPHCAGCSWGKDRTAVNCHTEAAMLLIEECMSGGINADTWRSLGDW